MACAELCSGGSPFPTASAFGEENEVPQAAATAQLGNKLNYFFGKATGRQHNIDRSIDLARQLARIGIYDTPSGRQYLAEHLNEVLADPANIATITKAGVTVRESLLAGPNGVVMLKTTWDGNKLKTPFIYGGGR